jgi:hypothetical protein
MYSSGSSHFASVLHSKPEDAITETLALLLRDDDWWSVVLSDFPKNEERPQKKPEKVTTQPFGHEGGRPDLILAWEHLRIAIEVKFWASTTPAQEKGYDKWKRSPGIDTKIFFLGPSSRENELKRFCEAFIHWETVIAQIGKKLASIQRLQTKADFWAAELITAIEREVGVMFRAFTDEETRIIKASETPQTLRKCLDLVDGIFAHLGNNLRTLKKDSSITTGSSGGLYYGFSLRQELQDRQEKKAWFGFWIGPWHTNGHSPLWLQIFPPEEADVILKALGGTPIRCPYGYALVPIIIRADAEIEDYISDIEGKMRKAAGAVAELKNISNFALK